MRLPDSVQEIADVIGRDRALYLVGKLPRCYMPDRKGGHNARLILYVPKRMGFDHELVKILGWQDAERLRRVFGGEILHPAPCAEIYRRWRDDSIRRMVREGIKPAALAEWFGMTPRNLANIVRGGDAGEVERPEAANDNTVRKPARGMRA